MSITIIKEGNQLRLIESEGPIPENKPVRLYTEDELAGLHAWRTLPAESKETLLAQTQSAAYREWLEEDDWEQPCVEEGLSEDLSLDQFKA
jgi:hypothetical protein